MAIDLTPEQQEFIAAAIESGRFKSAQEAAESLRRLNADIELGLAELDAGLVLDGETVFGELRAKIRARVGRVQAD